MERSLGPARAWLAKALPASGRWIARSWWQIALVVVVLLGYRTYQNHLRETRALAAASRIEAALVQSERREQDQRAYAAKRRGECYDIYVKERQKFNNVEGPEYDAADDVCNIRYKSNRPDPGCKNILAMQDDTGSFGALLAGWKRDCRTNTFTRAY